MFLFKEMVMFTSKQSNDIFLDLEIQLFPGLWVTGRQLMRALDTIALEAILNE